MIKASDFTDNGVGLIHTTGPKLEKLAGKYAPLVPIFKELIAQPDTPPGRTSQEAYPRAAHPGRAAVRSDPAP